MVRTMSSEDFASHQIKLTPLKSSRDCVGLELLLALRTCRQQQTLIETICPHTHTHARTVFLYGRFSPQPLSLICHGWSLDNGGTSYFHPVLWSLIPAANGTKFTGAEEEETSGLTKCVNTGRKSGSLSCCLKTHSLISVTAPLNQTLYALFFGSGGRLEEERRGGPD